MKSCVVIVGMPLAPARSAVNAVTQVALAWCA